MKDYGRWTMDYGPTTKKKTVGPWSNGFTLIETVLTFTLIAAGILGILTLFQRNVSEANTMEHTLRATYLAQERMEQIIYDKKYQLYAYIDPKNYPATEDLTSQGFSGYTRTINIVEVNANDLITHKKDTGYKRVTVSVAVAGGDTVTLTTLLTQWGEQ